MLECWGGESRGIKLSHFFILQVGREGLPQKERGEPRVHSPLGTESGQPRPPESERRAARLLLIHSDVRMLSEHLQ